MSTTSPATSPGFAKPDNTTLASPVEERSSRTTAEPSASHAEHLSCIALWQDCLAQLKEQLPSQEFATFLLPLQAESAHVHELTLLASNQVVLNHVQEKYLATLREHMQKKVPALHINLCIGSCNDRKKPTSSATSTTQLANVPGMHVARRPRPSLAIRPSDGEYPSYPLFTFENHIEGESNKIARAACQWVSRDPGSRGYTPLYIYGASGLGKTHLILAVYNEVRCKKPQLHIAYVRSVDFVRIFVNALRKGQADQFQKECRSLDILLLDDIHFLANKERSQDELFHTFNELFDGQKQIIVTCDRMPVEFETSPSGAIGIQKRLASRLGSGLTVHVAPPEFETRVAILKKKATSLNLPLGDEVAFFIAQNIHSNVRDLEGTLHKIMAYVRFTSEPMNIDTARKALQDQLTARARILTVDNIQKTVAEYYRIRVSTLRDKGRGRNVVRPRHVAMALARELTELSLPDIGEAFGGRDHSTVLHACRKIEKLQKTDQKVGEDYDNLRKTLGG